jgi:hypothetical protein
MTSVIRYTEVVNATGAVFTPVAALTTSGKEGTLKHYKRTFAAIDIGTEAGKTRSDDGCLLVTITGATIKDIAYAQLWETEVINGRTYSMMMNVPPAADQFDSVGLRISADGKSIYIIDKGLVEDGNSIGVDDYIRFGLIVGNY